MLYVFSSIDNFWLRFTTDKGLNPSRLIQEILTRYGSIKYKCALLKAKVNRYKLAKDPQRLTTKQK